MKSGALQNKTLWHGFSIPSKSQLLLKFVEGLQKFSNNVFGLSFTDKPDYEHLRHSLLSMFFESRLGSEDESFLFDWNSFEP